MGPSTIIGNNHKGSISREQPPFLLCPGGLAVSVLGSIQTCRFDPKYLWVN